MSSSIFKSVVRYYKNNPEEFSTVLCLGATALVLGGAAGVPIAYGLGLRMARREFCPTSKVLSSAMNATFDNLNLTFNSNHIPPTYYGNFVTAHGNVADFKIPVDVNPPYDGWTYPSKCYDAINYSCSTYDGATHPFAPPVICLYESCWEMMQSDISERTISGVCIALGVTAAAILLIIVVGRMVSGCARAICEVHTESTSGDVSLEADGQVIANGYDYEALGSGSNDNSENAEASSCEAPPEYTSVAVATV